MTEAARAGFLKAIASSWPLLAIGLALSLLGVLTMHPFGAEESLAPRQLIWIGVGVVVYILFALSDMHVIRRTGIVVGA